MNGRVELYSFFSSSHFCLVLLGPRLYSRAMCDESKRYVFLVFWGHGRCISTGVSLIPLFLNRIVHVFFS